MPESQMDKMGEQSFAALKKESKIDTNKSHQAFVQCVTNALLPSLPAHFADEKWEVVVFVDKSPNAFALPGGKIGVNTGMITLVSGQDELAVVLGHELAHVIAGHSNERVSTQMATELGINLIAASAGSSGVNANRTAALLGAGAQLGILLPFSRTQESEADKMGLTYMANAGFNPQASVTLWKKMAAEGKEKPEFLQTHPSSQNRVQQFETWMFDAESDYNAAKRMGKAPKCSK
ncbi:MAG: M48 family metallopeptidase [Gammaproteobacteria bacterium]